MPSPLKLLVATLGSLLLVVGLASPAPARPAKASTPYLVASSPHTVTLKWAPVANARGYTVFVASTPSKAARTKQQTRASRGRHTTLKIRDLRPHRRYCFTVRAVRDGDKGPRSEPVCGHTLRRSIDRAAPSVSVVTFNVCAYAENCKRWTRQREDAIVQRIVDANADVVALQEVTGRADELATRLRDHGYASYTARLNKRNEAVYYRMSALELAVTTEASTACVVEPYAGLDDTSAWRFPRHFDEPTQQWYSFATSGWFTEQKVCRDRQLPVEQEGRISSPTGATAAWAALRLRSNGQTYMFVSAHLTHGPTTADARLRGRETRQLIANTEALAGAMPIIYMGDFNSYRGGPGNDPPRREMAKRGWVDAFDASATYSRPNVSSFNGWRAKVQTMKYWGGHIDRIFVRTSMGSTDWRIVAPTKNRRYVGAKASDHNPVRTTIVLS